MNGFRRELQAIRKNARFSRPSAAHLSSRALRAVAGVWARSEEQVLPELSEGKQVAPLELSPTQHFTSPPPRFTEASLVKALETEGIGRPSTYASIIATIQDRRYVELRIAGFMHPIWESKLRKTH